MNEKSALIPISVLTALCVRIVSKNFFIPLFLIFYRVYKCAQGATSPAINAGPDDKD